MLTEKLLAIDNSTLKPILLQDPRKKPPMYNPLDYDVAVAIGNILIIYSTKLQTLTASIISNLLIL
jgi:hypothetical protein